MSILAVQREFMALVADDARFSIAGSANGDPDLLFQNSLKPRHKIELFDTTYYLTNIRQIPELRFMVAYIVSPVLATRGNRGRDVTRDIAVRVFYKDLSLAWRVASHYTLVDDVLWIGKGDVHDQIVDGEEVVASNESTTDIPVEMQSALELLIRNAKPSRGGLSVLDLVVRKPPGDRLRPYRDFIAPRQKAQSNPGNLINRGRSVARFTRRNDPTSLKIVAGYEPDFKNGIIERTRTRSGLYGGVLRRFRILSVNREIQYYFFAGKKHVWLMPPQATTTALSSYGVRTVDVVADDDLFIPGYEYHHYEDSSDGPVLYSQIPPGFAGEVCPYDEDKADASPWLDRIPLIKQFRRQVLK